VLIAAHRGQPAERQRAHALLNDESGEFAASLFLELETVSKAVYYGNTTEVQFYRMYFDAVRYMVNDVEDIARIAMAEAERWGLAAMDALHIAAAYLAGAAELVTLERKERPIYRTSLVQVREP
jgi:hypothetical protein